MEATHTFSPMSATRIAENSPLPEGFSLGAHCPQFEGNYYYVIRDSDGSSLVCRATPCEDEVLPDDQLAETLHEEMDRNGQF